MHAIAILWSCVCVCDWLLDMTLDHHFCVVAALCRMFPVSVAFAAGLRGCWR